VTRGEKIEVGTKRGSDTHKTEGKIRYIEESHGGEGGKDEVHVEVKGDREGSDVSHPREESLPDELVRMEVFYLTLVLSETLNLDNGDEGGTWNEGGWGGS